MNQTDQILEHLERCVTINRAAVIPARDCAVLARMIRDRGGVGAADDKPIRTLAARVLASQGRTLVWAFARNPDGQLRRGDGRDRARLAVYVAAVRSGHSRAEIARELGVSVSIVIQGVNYVRRPECRKLAAEVDRIIAEADRNGSAAAAGTAGDGTKGSTNGNG